MSLAVPFTIDRPLLAAVLIAACCVASWAVARRSWAEGSPSRKAASLACRIALLGLLCLALAGLQWRRERADVAVSFAVDSSDSVGAAREDARRILREAAAAARPGDRAAVVQFGRDALIERGLGDDLSDVALASTPQGDGSDLASAARLARGLLPPDGRRRVVVMTDGEASGDDPAGALRALRDEGLDVVLVPLAQRAGPETLVDEIVAPDRVHEGEPYEVRVLLRASQAATGTLTITRDGALVSRSAVDVPAGKPAAFRFVERADAAGSRLYRAHFDASPDGFEQNDAAETIVRVEGQPSVLILDPEPQRLQPVAALLKAGGLKVDVAPPEGLPRTVAEASRHAAIVLSDVDSLNLTQRQMSALRSFVRETGGGLLMTGGPQSFGPGGWRATPVEDVLPVDMDVRNEKYYPSLALVLCIDKSGSMAGADGASKIDLAKEAASQSAGLLYHGDRIGVIAFDSAAQVVVDPAVETTPPEAERLIGTIRAGGGTDIYPALAVAEEKMTAVKTVLKHVIVLSDGQSPPRDYKTVIERMRAAGVTTSAVAVGADADLATMQRLATWGGGRFYFTDDPASIPRIFTKEAFTTARSFVVEEPFDPKLEMRHPVMRGAMPLPQVLGYVATSAKPSAEVALVTHRGDPLLALRSFGLGRTGALTTDLGQRWAGAWLTSAEGRTLLSQLTRWLAGKSESSLLEASLQRRGGRVIVSVEARDERGGFLNFADLTAGVVAPDQQRQDVVLRQVAPGRYEGEVADRGPGAWFAGVVQASDGRVVRGATASRVFPYSDEYRVLQAPADALGRLALASGARVVTDPALLFERSGPPAQALRPAWRELVLLAAVLLLLDVALRRVMLPEGWSAKAGAWLRARFARRRADTASTEGLSRLRRVKTDARDRAQGAAAPVASDAAAPVASDAAAPVAAPVPPPPAPAAPAPAPPRPAPPPPGETGAPAESAEAFRSRLLAAKRRAKSDRGQT